MVWAQGHDRIHGGIGREGRGEPGDFAVNVMCAVMGDERRRMVVNTTNDCAISDLPSDAIVELPCLVGEMGPQPTSMGTLPPPVRGLIQAVEGYERFTAEAAVTGDRRTALMALLAHPFLRSAAVAEAILDEGLAAHRDLLPQFWS
jgi:6-phospho-beta-glucosidase